MSVAFIFPGQGSQEEGMLHSLPDHPAVARTLSEAGSILGREVLEFDTRAALASTAGVQLALLIAGVALSRVLESEGCRPNVVAGLSVGAFGAAVAAGILPFGAALRTVLLRGTLMENALREGYGMTAIVGLSESAVAGLVRKVHSSGSPLFIAGVNAPRQIVISGATSALDAVAKTARLAGATRVARLKVGVPSHCELMRTQAETLAHSMAGIESNAPRIPYISSLGRKLENTESIRYDLAMNMAQPIRWHDSTELMYELGARLFVEMPPGQVLTELVSAAFPDARAIACSAVRVESVCALIRKETFRE
jgi:malonate decarboxylase epsilon subunit